jgi:hypothetical protein
MGEEPKKAEDKKERRFDPELLKKGLRCDLDQYEMLKRCSDAGNMTEWNEWREKNRDKDVFLEEAILGECYLKGVHLGGTSARIGGESKKGNDWKKVGSEVHLKGAHLCHAHLEEAGLYGADLRQAKASFVHIEGSDLSGADLRGAKFERATVSGTTSLWECKVDRETDFLGASLDVAKIDPATKQLLEYNIRRKNWEEWYKKRRLLKWPVRLFWCFSDYGISTWRIIGWFFGLALIFAAIYANCACWWPLRIVSNLEVEPHLPMWHYFLLLLLRPIYFSVVTMTTGFSNMYANAQSIWGHILIGIQVLLGYVLLGALVTRFAVLFTAGGPAGKFAKKER